MIEFLQLTKQFGDLTAVDGLEFTVDDGEIFGLLGPNGAGKSSLLKAISGVVPSTHGRIEMDGDLLN
ncbi:MAG: ATP-binding cassette domain-containing protein, partial [bacterium]|nr:ATP-binding cassette domain-containing protein [bacterium]